MRARRMATILLAGVIALHVIAGGGGRLVVLCLGDGHEHNRSAAGPCAASCPHETTWPLHAAASGRDCGCTDVEILLPDLTALPRDQDPDRAQIPAVAAVPAAAACLPGCRSGLRPAEALPCRDDLWMDCRLAILASIRLTI